MKNSIIYGVAVWMLIACSCGSESKKTDQSASDSTSVNKNVKPQMQSSVANQSATLNGKEYAFTISRHPDPELPEVKMEDGSSFLDNRIELVITKGGTDVFRRVFKKSDFKDVVDARFMEHAILEGIVYDRIENGKFLFAASVCYPMTDLYVPVRIFISSQGGMTLEKEDTIDDTLNDSISD